MWQSVSPRTNKRACFPAERRLPHGLVQLLDIVHEMDVIGSAQNDHLFGARRPLEYFVHTGQRKRNIVFRDQVQCRNLTTPAESELCLKNPRLRLGSPAWRERY